MGSRGPGKTPTRIRQLHGETRPSQLNDREPQPSGRPRMPTDMSDDAKKVWRRVMREYGHTGVLTGADTDILEAYCDAVARYRQAKQLLEKSSPLIRGRRGSAELVKNPLHQIVRDNVVLIRALAREIGLTPSARAGIEGKEKPTGDPLDTFLKDTG